MPSSDHASPFSPLHAVDGYLPIEDHGLIGDGSTAGLVARDGSVAWLCIPHFDGDPLFCSLLDTERGGSFRLAPTEVVEARQRYELDTGVLITELRSPDGLVRITDCLTLRGGADLREDVAAGRHELLRTVVAVDGSVRMVADVAPRGGATAVRRGDGVQVRLARRPEVDLQLVATVPLDGLRGTFDLRAGEEARFVLRWGEHPHRSRATDLPAL